MIVYRSTKAGFREDVEAGRIDQIIHENFQTKLKHSRDSTEFRPIKI